MVGRRGDPEHGDRDAALRPVPAAQRVRRGCLDCGDGPILAGELADTAHDADPQQLPSIVVDQLTAAGWRWATTALASGWVCCR